MADGSVILVEIESGEISRIAANGTRTVVAKPGGGPMARVWGRMASCMSAIMAGLTMLKLAAYSFPMGKRMIIAAVG